MRLLMVKGPLGYDVGFSDNRLQNPVELISIFPAEDTISSHGFPICCWLTYPKKYGSTTWSNFMVEVFWNLVSLTVIGKPSSRPVNLGSTFRKCISPRYSIGIFSARLSGSSCFSAWYPHDSLKYPVVIIGNQTRQRDIHYTDWWFGTFGLFFHMLEIIPTDELIFFRGVKITNQL